MALWECTAVVEVHTPRCIAGRIVEGHTFLVGLSFDPSVA